MGIKNDPVHYQISRDFAVEDVKNSKPTVDGHIAGFYEEKILPGKG
jgi:hypothetical protein